MREHSVLTDPQTAILEHYLNSEQYAMHPDNGLQYDPSQYPPLNESVQVDLISEQLYPHLLDNLHPSLLLIHCLRSTALP